MKWYVMDEILEGVYELELQVKFVQLLLPSSRPSHRKVVDQLCSYRDILRAPLGQASNLRNKPLRPLRQLHLQED